MKPTLSLRSRAMGLLARREMSRLELQRKLAPYAENEAELNQVLDEFSQKNWQSDERFTESFINSKSHKHGRLRLKQNLAAKGIDEALIHNYLPDEDSELQHAQTVLMKKFKTAARDFTEKQKQLRFLLYRGFTMDTALKAIHADREDFHIDE